MSSNPNPHPYKCHRYLDGHDIHPTRALRAAKHAEWQPVTNIAFDGQLITFDTPGHKHRGWNHDLARLKALVEKHADAEWAPKYRLLRFATDNGHALVGIGATYDQNGCYSEASSGGFIDPRSQFREADTFALLRSIALARSTEQR